MERVNGEQLKQTIDLLSVNYTKEEIIKMYNSQLTTKQLGEVVRQMLNDVKYDNTPTYLKEDRDSISKMTHISLREHPVYTPSEINDLLCDIVDNGIDIQRIIKFLKDHKCK